MKVINYEVAKNPILPGVKYEFKVVGSLTKTDFKALARMARLFKAEKGVYGGLIKAADEKAFLALVEKAEKANPKIAEKSHEAAKEKAAMRRTERRTEKDCEHEDLGSLGFKHGETVKCPHCGKAAEVW